MSRVARCDECRKLFELPEGVLEPEVVEQIQSTGIMPVRKVYLCPVCRQRARDQGQPPTPPVPALRTEADETRQEEHQEKQPPA